MNGVLRFLLRTFAFLFLGSILWVLLYRWVDPPVTFLMVRDGLRGKEISREWVPLSDINRNLQRAVIGAEDSRFCEHWGLDLEALRKAYQNNQHGKRLRGGSTISQQTAKNAFLWPGRTVVRKAVEAWFTLLIEALWSKPRIMEVYLNIIELGPGIYGAEAASRHYFGKPARSLTRTEAARLAAILPQPLKRDAGSPGRYTRRYADTIAKRARVVANDGLDRCLAP